MPHRQGPVIPLARQRAAEMGTGKWWIGLSDDAKNKLIERYTKAMNQVLSDLLTDCTDGVKNLSRNGAEEVDIVSSMILCKIASSFEFGFVSHEELREGVDSFYKDSTIRLQRQAASPNHWAGCRTFEYSKAVRMTLIEGFRERDGKLIHRAGIVLDFANGQR